MTIQEYLRVLNRHWVVITMYSALGAAAAFLLTSTIPKVYVATTTQFVRGVPNSGVPDYQSTQLALARAKSYTVLIANPDVLAGILSDTGTSLPPEEVYSRLSVSNPIDTTLIEVVARGRTAEEAQSLSIAAANNLAKIIMRLESAGVVGGKSPIDIQTAVPALRPNGPSSPRPTLNIAVGSALGLSVGSIIALGLDTRRSSGSRGAQKRRLADDRSRAVSEGHEAQSRPILDEPSTGASLSAP